MSAPPPVYLGIDLGTTNSAAAVFDGQRVTVVRSAAGGDLTPSVVRIDARGVVTVGARARRFLDGDPDNTRSEFKRLMGTAATLEFPAARVRKRPEELSAEVLRALRADFQDQLGFAPARAVISVPALFELPQSAATSEAARLAGFEHVELIQEPIASALAAGWTAESKPAHWLVFDLGGGTFDASLLETREGHLRVVGHDGDNFLGGRDFDWAVVDWALGELAASGGPRLSREEPAHAAAVRKIKLAAEEAKIELSRAARAALVVPTLTVGGAEAPVDLALDRATLERLCLPVVERALAVVRRLLDAHGVATLESVVLVGGPTVTPLVRERVAQALGAPIAPGADPMTLVAQGAALYAATHGVDARPAQAPAAAARRLLVQHPAVSQDLAPHVVGRLVEGGAGPLPRRVRLVRGDEGWQGEWTDLDAQGSFVAQVQLVPRAPNVFRLEAAAEDGAPVAVHPASITIVQGVTLGDPPLARTIGVALANDTVCVYFARGTPLPNRRTFVHYTVEGVARGAEGSLLRIPIVQGEYEQAHLDRLVGTLEIPGQDVSSNLPAGSPVEVTLELDRGGRLGARAFVPALGQLFEDVAHLLVPEATPEALTAGLAATRERLGGLRTDAFRRGASRTIERFSGAERLLGEVERDLAAARGGDVDAAQKARRTLLELDAMIEEAELEQRWPELEEDARERLAFASRWVSEYGTPAEQKLLGEVTEAAEKARQKRDPVELQRQLRLVRDLGTAAFHRNPDSWVWLFERAAADADGATDLALAQRLVTEGRKAVEKRDTAALRDVTQRLWRILPVDAESRRLGHDSGLR